MRPFGVPQSGASPPAGSVSVADRDPDRLTLLARVVSETGARPAILNLTSVPRPVALLQGRFPAVVGIGSDPSPNDPEFAWMRDFKAAGSTVIACASGAASWSIGLRCRVLLAGASVLLDSTDPAFEVELATLLGHSIAEAETRQASEEELRSLMRRLGIVGRSRPMLDVFQSVARAAPFSDLPVLIMGETGTGKELLARALHELDPKRRSGPFVPVNCAALSTALAESELFGHRRGAFTGADRDRGGLFRAAEGGVLFLDEVGELDAGLQAKLLRVLQDHRVIGLGEDRETPVSVRVLAATNRDLREMTVQGRFREDLFHRLAVLTVRIPSLAQRREDIPEIVAYFCEKYTALSVSGAVSAGPDFLEALQTMELPGNVRQVENFVRSALVRCAGVGPLQLADLPDEVWRQLSQPVAADSPPANADRPGFLAVLDSNSWNLERALEQCEREFLRQAMTSARGNQSEVARRLGISARSVYNKLRKHRLLA